MVHGLWINTYFCMHLNTIDVPLEVADPVKSCALCTLASGRRKTSFHGALSLYGYDGGQGKSETSVQRGDAWLIIMHGWWTSQCKVHMMMDNDWCMMEYQSLSDNHYPIDDDDGEWLLFFFSKCLTRGTRRAPSTADRSPWTAWNGAFRYGGPGPAGRLEGLQGISCQFVWEIWAGPYIYVYIDIDIHLIRRYLLKKSWTHNFWTLSTNSCTKIRKGATLGLSNREAEDEDKFNPRFRPLPHDEDKAPNHPTFQKLGPGGGKGGFEAILTGATNF